MKVKKVKVVRNYHDKLYDIGVKDNHNFVADMVVVHNCHRFSKNQMDVLLPPVEEGNLILIGSTTENPFHSVIPALLSRSNIFELEPLNKKHLTELAVKAIKFYKDNGWEFKIDKDAILHVIRVSNGDGRKVLNLIEVLIETADGRITTRDVEELAPNKYMVLRDSEHYDYASWMQGAIQASDPDAAVYALAKWLESGEDIRYIARRLMVSASEDASSNPCAAMIAQNAFIAAKEIGRPESDIILSHAVCEIATSKRDKSAAKAIWSAIRDVRDNIEVTTVPKSMRDSHYKGAKRMGHGKYKDGSNPEAYVGINKQYYFPEGDNDA